jgi:hypothetical protein
MTNSQLARRACVALMGLTLAACKDNGPSVLTEAQVGEMIEAMASVNALGAIPGTSMAIINVSETIDCPNGGTATVAGSVNDNDGSGTATVQVTQSFNACRATSSHGRVWTFDGDPNVTTNVTMTADEEAQTFSISGSQVGGIRFSSDLGSGSCSVNLTTSMSGGPGSLQASLSGTACGHTVERSFSFSQ